MQGNRQESAVEVALRRELHRRGLRFRKQMKVVDGSRSSVDVVFTKQRLAVFVDGCFWHRCPEHGSSPKANASWWRDKLDRNVARDRATDETLERAGWRVLRLWEHEPVTEMAAKVEVLLDIDE